MRDDFDLTLRYRVFPLHPETPEEGLSLDRLFLGRVDIAAMHNRLCSVAKELGLSLAARSRTFNSRRAQELCKWAEHQGKLEEYNDAVYRAYFNAALNIADPEVLSLIARSIGLDEDEAQQVLKEGRYASAVDEDWQRARALGVNSVPTLLYGTRALVGFRPYGEYRKLITGQQT